MTLDLDVVARVVVWASLAIMMLVGIVAIVGTFVAEVSDPELLDQAGVKLERE